MRRILGGGLLALVPAWAAAQQVDPVVVTATRGPRPSLEIPASIDRIYGEDIREGRPQVNLSEDLGRVPGIVVQNRQNYAQDLQISSRGFGARSTFGVRGVRLIADGIPATMPDGQGQAATFALGSAERIEVLRGPFSSLYGNAAGGVIVVDTQDGPETPTAEAGLYFGSYDAWRASGKFGGQWGRFNAIGELSRFETDGYRQHSAAVRDQLNAKFKYQLQEKSDLTLVANSLNQPDTEDPLGLNRAQVQQDPRQAVANAFLFNTRKSVFHDQVGLSLNHRLSGASAVQVMVYGGQRDVEQFLAIPLTTQTATLTHSGGVVDLERDFGGGALRYSTGFANVRLALGVEYDRMDERRRGFINNFGVAEALRRDEDDRATSTDVYAQGEWQFAERWTAHAGVRSSKVEFRVEDHYIVAGNGNDSGERSYSATTPVVGLIFRPSETLSVYGNLGEGFETPTFAELAYQSVSGSGPNFALNASYSRHAEIGLKALFQGRARVNVALFDIVTRDEIVVDQNSGGRSTFKNAGHTDRNGLELFGETLLGGPLEARVAYTYLKAVFRDSFTTVQGTPGVPVTVPAGSLLPGVPRYQLYGDLRYRKGRYYAQLEGLRKSRVAVNDTNSEFADGYSVFNVVGGLVQQGRRWRVTEFVRVDNLTDKNYVGSVIVNDGNLRYYEPSPRRNYSLGVQASLQF